MQWINAKESFGGHEVVGLSSNAKTSAQMASARSPTPRPV